METPIITGILRKSPELARSTFVQMNTEDAATSTITPQDKGPVRFSEEDSGVSKMNTKLLTTPTETIGFAYGKNTLDSTVMEEDDEDYSTSASAIMQRVSSKRKKRRSSSPFSHEDFSAQSSPRRRSSGMTVTSLETNPSTEESGYKQEQIYENIRLHKEVITNVKQQSWPIRRKLKLLQQAKTYVKRHEGELQDRLKQSRSTKDICKRFNILIIKKWQRTKREIVNFMNLLIPWESRIKEIESHFGTVVASYFIFLRWLFWVNLMISIILAAFVIVPEILDKHDKDCERKQIFGKSHGLKPSMLINIEGDFMHSPVFYGYYSDKDGKTKYHIPTAYFMIGVGVYIYSFFAILRKMAVNFRLSKLSEKEDDCTFTWKLFTGWDYTIGNAETGHNRTSSIVLGFKEALLEEAEKRKEKLSWKIISIRIFVNINVCWMLILSAQTVIYVVNKTGNEEETTSQQNDHPIIKWWKQNETTFIMVIIASVFPIIFELFGWIEKFHPRTTLQIQLGRIMALNLLNLYSLTFAQFNQIGNMNTKLGDIMERISNATIADHCPHLPNYIASPIYCNDSSCLAASVTLPVNVKEFFTDPAKGTYVKNSLFAQVVSQITNTHQEPTAIYTPNFNTTSTKVNTTQYSANIDEYISTTEIRNPYSTSDFSYNISTTEASTEDSTFTSDMDVTNITDFSTTDTAAIYSTSRTSTDEKERKTTTTILSTSESKYDTSTMALPTTTSQNAENGTNITTSSTVSTPTSQTTVTKPVQISTLPTCSSTTSNLEAWKRGNITKQMYALNATEKDLLIDLCWETMFGRELVKLTTMDLAENMFSTFMGDFVRALLIRYLNKIWCWDLEKKFPKYADFKIAENILHLIYSQGLVWMGMFFSPGLPLINVIKLMIMMYLRSWAVLTCNVPHEVVFRASRSNNFYLVLLLLMLFLCVLPVCYAIVWLTPSWHCGPFARNEKIYLIFTKSLKSTIKHPSFHKVLDYIASPGTVIPLIIALLLVIYYLASLTSALREANVDLKIQLRRERTEERKKVLQMANRRKRGGSDVDSTFTKWQKILHDVPSTKLSDEVAFPNVPDDGTKAEDTDADITHLKHDEEEKQKIRKIFRARNKTESASEKKWGTLLKMVPKQQKEVPEKESDSTTSSVKDDSSMKSENIPEIKISRVQTFENIAKVVDKIKPVTASKIEEEKSEPLKETECQLPKTRAVIEKLQKRSNLKQIGKSAKFDSDSEEIEDDVFVGSVIVDVPEMPRITESISTRIKRRLKKVLSMGSHEDNRLSPENERKDENPSASQQTYMEEFTDSASNLDKSSEHISTAPSTSKINLSIRNEQISEHGRGKLVKSESMNLERGNEWENYMKRRKSSLDELHFRLPDV